MASTIITKNTIRQGIIGSDSCYDLHGLFTTPGFGLRLCIKKCCILRVTGFLDIRLNNVTTEKSFSGRLYLDVHEMFEKLGLTQEIRVTLDRIRDLSESQYVMRRGNCTGEIPCSCPSLPA